jgi:hypothetical protein
LTCLSTRMFFKRFSAWCYRAVTIPLLLIAVAVFALFMVIVLPNMAGRLTDLTGVNLSPDTSFLYSAKDLYAMAEAYGSAGRAYYIFSRFTFDLAWPAVYLLFLATLITRFFRFLDPGDPRRLVNLLPFIAVFFDLLENSTASLVMFRYPLASPVAVILAPAFTFLKWIFIGLSFAALAIGLFIFLYNCLKKFKTLDIKR